MGKKRKSLRKASVLLVIAIASGLMLTLTLSAISKEAIDAAKLTGSGILDGMTFQGKLGPVGKPADVEDTFVFDDGMFVSIECEKNCNFPARPYFTRRVDNTIEFISETRCPDKDAKILWRGTVENDAISGVFTWTISRWYWTVEKDFRFSGRLVAENGEIAKSP